MYLHYSPLTHNKPQETKFTQFNFGRDGVRSEGVPRGAAQAGGGFSKVPHGKCEILAKQQQHREIGDAGHRHTGRFVVGIRVEEYGPVEYQDRSGRYL